MSRLVKAPDLPSRRAPSSAGRGVIATLDRRTIFINVQHPGEVTRAWATTAQVAADPQAIASSPDHAPAGRPRSATVVITKDDGGVLGT